VEFGRTASLLNVGTRFQVLLSASSLGREMDWDMLISEKVEAWSLQMSCSMEVKDEDLQKGGYFNAGSIIKEKEGGECLGLMGSSTDGL
jgi:hypothetical protein